jgi:phosphotriesterase-related protein
MAHVLSVLGPVEVDGPLWGPVDAHEHLLMDGGLVPDRFPELHLHDVEACVREVGDVAAAGGRVVIEATPIGLGRRPRELADVARRTGVVIVAATGFHKSAYYQRSHWLRTAGPDRLRDLMVADLTEGIDAADYAAPWVERTGVRAGIIKVATEHHAITDVQRRVFSAAAEAHLATGAPITTHAEAGTYGVAQVELLAAAGVPPAAVSVGHVDKDPDPGYHAELASTGAYLVFTNPGRTKYGPDSRWIDLLARLVERGHTERLLVGGDMAPRAMWRAYGGGPGIGWLFSGFHARLRAELGGEVAEAITVRNPAAAFAWR